MISTSKILVIWLSLGVFLGVGLAVLAVGPSGLSALFIPLGVIFGLISSVLHCLVLLVFERFKNLYRLFPAGILLAFCSVYFLVLKYNEYSCVISESKSLFKATEYINKIGYDIDFLDAEGYKLEGSCEFGFEYKSKKAYRLVIIDADGRARLND